MRINPTAKYLVLLACAVTLFFWKTVLSNQFTTLVRWEGVNYNYSWNRFWVDSLWHGRLPLWDPYAFAGRPFSAEMLPSAFYPLHLPFLLAPFNTYGLFSERLYHVARAATHLLGAYFAFALLRDFRLSRFAAFIGACCFSLSLVLTNLVWPPFVEAGIWLPAIFMFLLRALRAEQIPKAALEASLSGLCFGMSILTGGLHYSIMQAVAIVAASVYNGLVASNGPVSRRTHLPRVTLVLLIVLVVAGCAGAVQLLPSYEYGKLSLRFIDDGLIPATQKIPYHRLHPGMWPQSIITVLFPYGFSAKFGGGERWPMYIGTLPFFLAITAVWRCWSNLWVRYLTGLAIFAFAYSLSEFFALHGVLYVLVPSLWIMRVASRFVYLGSFALAMLAAFGAQNLLDDTNQDSWRSARASMKWIALACSALLFIPGILESSGINIWNALSLILIIASCGLYIYLTLHGAGSWLRFLVAAFILLDLQTFHWVDVNKSTGTADTKQLNQLISLRSVASFLKSQPELGRVRIAVDEPPNIGDAYGVQSVYGGGGTMLKSFERLWLRNDIMNVRYTVKLATATEPGPLYADAAWKVYENPEAYPRAWVVHQAIVEQSQDAALDRTQDANVDLRKVALLEKPLSQSVQEDSGAADLVTFRAYEADRMALDAKTERSGLLVLSEMHYPGWRATVNGTNAEIYRVNGGLRGIVLPAGESKIVLEYAPMTVYAGGAITLITFLGVSIFAFVWRRRNRTAPSEPKLDA